jgi:hypothetical protein
VANRIQSKPLLLFAAAQLLPVNVTHTVVLRTYHKVTRLSAAMLKMTCCSPTPACR